LCNEIPCAHNRIWCGLDYRWHHRGGLVIPDAEAIGDDLEVLAFNKALDAQFIEEG
jgi:hypothetical protein